MKYKILAADDEVELLDALELFMTKEGMELVKAKDGIEALRRFREEKPHLVVLDIMMPGVDGFSVLRKIREESRIPAIMLTARGEDYDKILGLELGADDYITKPYNPLEVIARMKAQLRRNYDYADSGQSQVRKITLFDLTFYLEEGRLLKGETDILLTRTEFLILGLLLKTPGRIYTKQQIFEHVWEDDYVTDDNTIMVHISNLRAKIEDDPRNPKILKTVKGLGYKVERE